MQSLVIAQMTEQRDDEPQKHWEIRPKQAYFVAAESGGKVWQEFPATHVFLQGVHVLQVPLTLAKADK